MLVCSQQKRAHLLKTDFNIVLSDIRIKCFHFLKILGVHIDTALKWNVHCGQVISKLSSLVGLLYSVQRYLDKKSMELFYNSYVLTRIDYCLSVWGNVTQEQINQLECLQKKCARIILNASYETPSTYLYSTLKWMNVTQRIIYVKSISVYKILNGLMPNHLKLLFTYTGDIPNVYNLRSTNNQMLHVPKMDKEFTRGSLRYSGAHMWNKLPSQLRTEKSFKRFKVLLKQFVFEHV